MWNVRSTGWRGRSTRAVLAAAAAAVLGIAAPANALLVLPSAGNCGPYGWQRCYGVGQSVPVGTSSLTVTFECTATTPFVVNSTGVGCYLLGDDGRRYAETGPQFTPGQQATVSRLAASVKFQGYQICVGAGFLTAGGYFEPVQNYNCSVAPFSGA